MVRNLLRLINSQTLYCLSNVMVRWDLESENPAQPAAQDDGTYTTLVQYCASYERGLGIFCREVEHGHTEMRAFWPLSRQHQLPVATLMRKNCVQHCKCMNRRIDDQVMVVTGAPVGQVGSLELDQYGTFYDVGNLGEAPAYNSAGYFVDPTDHSLITCVTSPSVMVFDDCEWAIRGISNMIVEDEWMTPIMVSPSPAMLGLLPAGQSLMVPWRNTVRTLRHNPVIYYSSVADEFRDMHCCSGSGRCDPP